MKKIYTLALCLLGLAMMAKAQNGQPPEPTPTWHLIKDESGVKIYYTREITCLNPNALALKIENTTTNEVKVDWVLPASVEQFPINQSNTNNTNVAAGQTIAAGCNTTAPIQLTLVVPDLQWIPSAEIFSITLIPAEK